MNPLVGFLLLLCFAFSFFPPIITLSNTRLCFCPENPLRYVRHAASSQAVERRRGPGGLRVSAVWQRRPSEGALQPHTSSRWHQQRENPRHQDVKELKGYIFLILQDRRQHQRGKQEEEREQPAAGAAEREQQTGRGRIRVSSRGCSWRRTRSAILLSTFSV